MKRHMVLFYDGFSVSAKYVETDKPDNINPSTFGLDAGTMIVSVIGPLPDNVDVYVKGRKLEHT